MKRLALLPIVLLAACSAPTAASVWKRYESTGRPQIEAPIGAIEDLKPQLRFPCVLAVAPPESWRHRQWSAEEQRAISETVGASGLVSRVVFLPRLLIESAEGSYVRRVREAGARMGADVVLVTGFETENGCPGNPLAILYLTLVGTVIVPGTNHTSVTVMEGIVADVRNGYVYAAGRGDAEARVTAPLAAPVRDDLDTRSRSEALRKMLEDLGRTALRPAAPGRAYPTPLK